MKKFRMSIATALGEADNSELTISFAKSFISGVEISSPVLYLDKENVEDIREEAHSLIDRIIDDYKDVCAASIEESKRKPG